MSGCPLFAQDQGYWTPSILDSWEAEMSALSQGSPKTISERANFHPRIWYLVPLYELLFKEFCTGTHNKKALAVAFGCPPELDGKKLYTLAVGPGEINCLGDCHLLVRAEHCYMASGGEKTAVVFSSTSSCVL